MKTRAPGKIILFGEYAVLDGYDALVIAVDRHVHTDVSKASSLAVDAGRFGRFPTTSNAPELPLIEDVVAQMGLAQGHFTLTSSGFECSEGKLGLGSSAASTVAFVGAALAHLGRKVRPKVAFKIAQNSHHRVQGLGSGTDIAASSFGGALLYNWNGQESGHIRHKLAISSNYGTAHLTPVTSPIKSILTVWTGQPANTRDLVIDVQKKKQTTNYKACISKLGESAARGHVGWTRGNRSKIIESIDIANEAALALGELTRVPLWTSAHHHLAKSVGARGRVKMTGAGGGDLAWVIGSTKTIEDELEAELIADGYLCFRMSIETSGLTLLE